MVYKLLMAKGYNHVCETCGECWESFKENEKCPKCGSRDTQSNEMP